MQAQRETADAESDTTVSTQGDASRRETEDREWASAIKAYHYHLQHAVQECTTNTNDTSSSSSTVVTTDLARWRAVLQRDVERARQRDYAAAMYKLATCFWDRSTEEGNTDNVEERKENNDDDSSVRRPRAEEQPSRKRVAKRKATLTHSSSAWRCSDQVQLCLDSIQEYFLGESIFVSTNDSENNNISRSVEHAGCVYARLPLIFSRALKPLRRAFYEMHHRMITPTELEQLLFHSWLNQSGDSVKGVTQCTEWPLLKLGTTRDLPCANDAWAVAAMYARALLSSSSATVSSTESNTLALPPLCALDVGSCYGPFFHRRLSHMALNDTPLQVTAIDLQPYRPSQCQAGTDSASSTVHSSSSSSLQREESDARADRRVWKGDWLTLSFYDRNAATLSSFTNADDDTLGKDVNSQIYFAEDGKLCIQRGSTSTSEEDVVCGVASAAYDVVIFCLLLSFLPTPRLRYLACLHAYLALKPQGLLVILSTRTQGSRRKDWIEDWVNGLQEIGFCRVHKQLCEKLVLLTFAKTGAVATTTTNKSSEAECDTITTTTPSYDLDSVEGRAAWLAMKMQSSTAATSLYITADDAH